MWHPFFGGSPAYEETRDFYYDYPSIVQQIKETATSHGFSGEYYAGEIGWSSHEFPPTPDNYWLYTEIQATKYYARGVVMHLGMDISVEVGGVFPSRVTPFATVQNLCTLFAGAMPEDVAVEIQSTATNIRSYGFSLPGGEKMVALWTDGVAVDNDPGVPATLVFRDFSAQRMTGIDVLSGFHQELVTEENDGNLIINNLVVKDYPIIVSSAIISNTATETDTSPLTFALHQNYPNPFNPTTTIPLELKKNAQVSLKIYNILGQSVLTLVDGFIPAGTHQTTFDASGLPSGMYIYRLEAGEYRASRFMMLVK